MFICVCNKVLDLRMFITTIISSKMKNKNESHKNWANETLTKTRFYTFLHLHTYTHTYIDDHNIIKTTKTYI